MSPEQADTWTRFFDFNDARLPLSSLGPEVGFFIQDALETAAHAPTPRRAAIAAIHAARLALPKLALLTDEPSEAHKAFTTICASLELVETALRQTDAGERTALLSPSPRKGRPATPLDALAFQGRAVIAVVWLRGLKRGALSKDDALSRVAKEIPDKLLSQRGHQRLPPKKQLAEWIDQFSRTDDTKRQRVIADLRFEIWEAWFHSWREVGGINAATGEPVYRQMCCGLRTRL